MFIGSMTVLLNGLPIPGYQDFLDSFPGGTLRSILQTIQTATVGILAIYLTIALNVSYTNPVIYNPLMLILLYQGYLFSPAVDREELIARKTPEA
ncbi:MAG: hypothetical protein IJT05_03510 [Lachnospiraceae bacterium]|nr:hypothetical protein [Lachnospiraceae bacterium]